MLLHVLYMALKMATNMPVLYSDLRQVACQMDVFAGGGLFDEQILEEQWEHEHDQRIENHIMEHLRGRFTRVTPYRLICQVTTALCLTDVLKGTQVALVQDLLLPLAINLSYACLMCKYYCSALKALILTRFCASSFNRVLTPHLQRCGRGPELHPQCFLLLGGLRRKRLQFCSVYSSGRPTRP